MELNIFTLSLGLLCFIAICAIVTVGIGCNYYEAYSTIYPKLEPLFHLGKRWHFC